MKIKQINDKLPESMETFLKEKKFLLEEMSKLSGIPKKYFNGEKLRTKKI